MSTNIYTYIYKYTRTWRQLNCISGLRDNELTLCVSEALHCDLVVEKTRNPLHGCPAHNRPPRLTRIVSLTARINPCTEQKSSSGRCMRSIHCLIIMMIIKDWKKIRLEPCSTKSMLAILTNKHTWGQDDLQPCRPCCEPWLIHWILDRWILIIDRDMLHLLYMNHNP